MADDVEMIPVEAAEPPKVNPLSAAAAPKVATLKLNPVARKPVLGGASSALKPGLKLPPKPGMAAGLKLPSKPGLAAGVKLPPKPGLAAGVKLPPKPGLAADVKLPPKPALAAGVKPPTVAFKPGVKLPPKPVIRKPGATVAASPSPKPVAVDALGVGKLPTVEAKAVDRNVTAPVVSAVPNAMEALKTVTQKLKGITQEIPQQAILHKTGIIAEGAMSEVQKEASKHKTARISLSDAMGVAPVKNENAPMKTIRIKRPIDIPGEPLKAETPPSAATPAPAPVAAEPKADVPPVEVKPVPSAPAVPAAATAAPAPTVTQRKTLKISRPGGAIRPAGKFGVKRPTAPEAAKPTAADGAAPAVAGEAPVAEIADIPEMPSASVPSVSAVTVPVDDVPSWVMTLSALVQVAACIAIGALAWFLYQNTQTSYF